MIADRKRLRRKGQSDSKGASKRSTPYTRGTAMSFGFKKRAHSAIPTCTSANGGTVIVNARAQATDNSRTDDNGNSGSLESLTGSSPVPSGRTTPRLAPPRKEAAGPPLRTNRFGFRQNNQPRPALAGLTAKVSDVSAQQPHIQSQTNNNLEKPRPKTSPQNIITHMIVPQPKIKTANTTQNLQQQSAAAQLCQQQSAAAQQCQQQSAAAQQFQQQSAPTQPALPPQVTKFTLHTSNLPKPQYAVRVMESKGAKTAANNIRKVTAGTQVGGEYSDATDNEALPTVIDVLESSPRRARCRPRNLEMVMRGNHNFEVRDLDDSFSEEIILPLPKLPSVFSNAQTGKGYVRERTVEMQQRHLQITAANIRKISNTSSEGFHEDSCDEEKAYRDRSSSEKDNQGLSKDFSPSSKGSSPGSSKASSGGMTAEWAHGGESMAFKDDFSYSFSSSDESKDKEIPPLMATSLSINTGLQNLMNNSMGGSIPKQPMRNILLTIEDPKFAAVAAAASAQSLLDDETSPVDSLISSCTDSDDLVSKKKKSEDFSKEKDSAENVDNIHSPMSPGTPTNASNSLSLSEGRDFLIDDEIADQPALVFNDKKSSSADQASSSLQLLSLTDNTITLHDSMSTPAPSLNRTYPRAFAAMHTPCGGSPSPLRARRPLLSRTGSLDTLSPCESIASDDLMMDFDHSHSSIDSDRLDCMASGSALHSLDEATIMSELEAKGGQVMKEWSSLLGTHKPSRPHSRDIGAQLPARATRLLNRSRVSLPDAPRSLEGLVRRTPTLRPPRQAPESPDDGVRFDRAAHGSMVQDIVGIKTMLLKLKRVLQEPEEDNLQMTETLNPFDNQLPLKNGLFYSGDAEAVNSLDSEGQVTPGDVGSVNRQELADLRRQVVFLQSQLEDKERTVQLLQLQMTKYSTAQLSGARHSSAPNSVRQECEPSMCHAATQTERVRPVSAGPSLLQGLPIDNNTGIVSWNEMNGVRTPRPAETNRNPTSTSNLRVWKKPWHARDHTPSRIPSNNVPPQPCPKTTLDTPLDKRKSVLSPTTNGHAHIAPILKTQPHLKTNYTECYVSNGLKSLPNYIPPKTTKFGVLNQVMSSTN